MKFHSLVDVDALVMQNMKDAKNKPKEEENTTVIHGASETCDTTASITN